MVGDFLKTVKKDFSAPIVAAIVNCELHELTYPVEMESQVTPITMDTVDGARIYRRSLICLLEMGFADLFPKGKLTIDHSLSWEDISARWRGADPFRRLNWKNSTSICPESLKEDMPFERREVPIQEAIEYFKKIGFNDKVRLLKHSSKHYLTLYALKDRMDYLHGYMVPSTGYFKWFELSLINGGFTLHFPRRHSPTALEPMGDYPKLLAPSACMETG